MKQTPPIQGQAQQQQLLLLLQHSSPTPQQLGQQVLQQPQPMRSPPSQPMQLQQPMLQSSPQLLAQQVHTQQPQQLPQDPPRPLPQQHFQPLHQQMHVQQLQQHPYMPPPQLPQQFTQQAQMQLQHLPQQLQQQHLQVQQHGQIPGLQRPLIPQQQPQLYPRQQLVSPQRQQSPLQPHQAQHSQLQQQQLQMHLQQQQQQVLNQPQAQQQEGHLAVHRVASPIPGSSNGSGVSSSANALRISPLASRQPQPNRGAPQGASKPAGVMGGAAAAGASPVSAAPIEAVQIAARPGSASTVADLVREAIEAAEAAEYDADSYGEAREADEGFAEDDLLDFTEDIAALMEAFLNPAVAVAAQTLEVTVQLALDFVDELVAKGLEARRQHEDTTTDAQEGTRPQPQLSAEDLLGALCSHPRKALRCREALRNYSQIEDFKCAFPEDRYLSAPPLQTQACASPQAGTSAAASSPAGPSPPGAEHQGQPETPTAQGQPAHYESTSAAQRTPPQPGASYGHTAVQAGRAQPQAVGPNTGESFTPAAAGMNAAPLPCL